MLVEISQLLADARQQLASISDTPALDSQVLLAHLLGRSRAWLLAHGEYRLSVHEQKAWERALALMAGGMPLPYLLGRREFYGLDLLVTPDVLIPRPETEGLVSAALNWLHRHPGPRLATDVGTGSGCIAISLLVHEPELVVLGCDLSRRALQVAVQNAEIYRVRGRFLAIQANLLPPISAPLDLICANLPYIPTDILSGLAVFGREPTLALDGGPDGLRYIQAVLQQSPDLLAPGGCLIMEIEASQGVAVQELARASFPAADLHLLNDLAGLDRLLVIET